MGHTHRETKKIFNDLYYMSCHLTSTGSKHYLAYFKDFKMLFQFFERNNKTVCRILHRNSERKWKWIVEGHSKQTFLDKVSAFDRNCYFI